MTSPRSKYFPWHKIILATPVRREMHNLKFQTLQQYGRGKRDATGHFYSYLFCFYRIPQNCVMIAHMTCVIEKIRKSKLAVDRVKLWLTYIVCPWYHNDPIDNKDFGLLLKTRGYWGNGAYIWAWNTSFRYSASTEHEELPYVLDSSSPPGPPWQLGGGHTEILSYVLGYSQF